AGQGTAAAGERRPGGAGRRRAAAPADVRGDEGRRWIVSDEGRLDHTLDRVVRRHREGQAILSEGKLAATEVARRSKEFSELDPLVDEVRALRRAEEERREVGAMAADAASDGEMRDMAEAEGRALDERILLMRRSIQLLLLPRDEAD